MKHSMAIHTVLMLSAAAVCAAAPAAAQRTDDAARKQLTAVELNDANLAKFVTASHNLADYVQKHPGAIKGDDGKDYGGIDEASKALCESQADVRKLIESAGTTCKTYFTLIVRFEWAGTAASIVDAGKPVPAAMSAPPSDLAFYRKHKAEITQALKDVGAEAPGA